MTASILTCRLGDGQRRVHEAARRAGLDPRPWSGRRDWSQTDAPAFVVAGLGRGERRIPSDVVEVVTNVISGAPLLLLCEDELVSRTSSIHRGRVVLVGPPHLPSRVFSELRILFALTQRGTVTRKLANGSHIHERASSNHWSACLEASAGEECSTLLLDEEECFTAVLALEGTVHRADAAQAARILRSPSSDAERAEELRSSLGTRAGVIHLDASGNEWALYWPHDEAPMVIHSALRLPSTFRPPKRGDGGASIVRLDTCEGDVLLALTARIGDGRLTELAPEMGAGGPAVLEAALGATANEGGVCGLVVEVRT